MATKKARIPATGAFYCFKGLRPGSRPKSACFAVLRVPANAKRVDTGSDKIRVSSAEVVLLLDNELRVTTEHGLSPCVTSHSSWQGYGPLKYTMGATMKPHEFNGLKSHHCAAGINACITLYDAANYAQGVSIMNGRGTEAFRGVAALLESMYPVMKATKAATTKKKGK